MHTRSAFRGHGLQLSNFIRIRIRDRGSGIGIAGITGITEITGITGGRVTDRARARGRGSHFGARSLGFGKSRPKIRALLKYVGFESLKYVGFGLVRARDYFAPGFVDAGCPCLRASVVGRTRFAFVARSVRLALRLVLGPYLRFATHLGFRLGWAAHFASARVSSR